MAAYYRNFKNFHGVPKKNFSDSSFGYFQLFDFTNFLFFEEQKKVEGQEGKRGGKGIRGGLEGFWDSLKFRILIFQYFFYVSNNVRNRKFFVCLFEKKFDSNFSLDNIFGSVFPYFWNFIWVHLRIILEFLKFYIGIILKFLQ